MQKEQITLLKELVRKFAGKNTEAIADIIGAEKPVNEFKIAEKLKLTINQTRNILYKLSAQSIVSFVRKKDEKKGWYIYSWSINTPAALKKLIEIKKKEIKNYEHLLGVRETRGFYVCPSGCMETNEENALLYQFKCPECGKLLQPKSFEEEKEELRSKIEKARKEIVSIEAELGKISALKEKEEEKEKEKRIAKAKRARKAKARAKKKAKAREKIIKAKKIKPKKAKGKKKKIKKKAVKKGKKKEGKKKKR